MRSKPSATDLNKFQDIALVRSLTEEHLTILLQRADAPVTVDDVKQTIFDAGRDDFRGYLTSMLSAINSSIEDVDEVTLQLIQDAWNYFPHQFLDGRCPVEVFREMAKDTKQ